MTENATDAIKRKLVFVAIVVLFLVAITLNENGSKRETKGRKPNPKRKRLETRNEKGKEKGGYK